MAAAMRVEVDGIEISPEQCTRSHGWKTAGERVRQNGVGQLTLTPVLRASQDGGKATAEVNSRSNNLGSGATGSDTSHSTVTRINKGKLLKGARMPELPRGDIKIVLRLRGGLRLSDVTRVELSRTLAAAAQIPANEANDDVVCLNLQQNIVVVSTSKRARRPIRCRGKATYAARRTK